MNSTHTTAATIVRSKRMRFALIAAVSVAGLTFSAGNAAADTPPAEEDAVIVMPEATCPKDGKIDVNGSHKTVTVTAPEGKLIAGYCVNAVREGRSLGSLAILARRRATLPVLGFALDHFGVPYVVSGRDLYGTPEVRDVFAALRLSQQPRDRQALAVIARSPLGGLSDQALLELSQA